MRYPTTTARLFSIALATAFLASCATVENTSSSTPTATDATAKSDTSARPAQQTSTHRVHTPPVFTPEQQSELGPLPASETDLWEVVVNGYTIPDLEGPLVDKWERWYASRPDYVARMVERSRLYLYHIVHEVKARNMPMEVALLPMIESAYNPVALSTSRASGIWQFIPSTGKNYGLKQDWWVDERRDVLAATDSALDYLQKLYGDFNDWQLALAAYNWGEGSVSRALAKNRAKDLPQTYESLKMPNETANYVPKLQAVKNIIRDPGKYNLELADIPDAPYFTVVKTTRHMDVDMAVKLAEMSKEEFLALNPQHNRPVIAGADEYTLLLPIDRAELFATKLELADQPLVTWQAYRLRKGETFAQVAGRFNMSLEALRAVNGLGARAQAREGVTLLVPAQQPSSITEASLVQADLGKAVVTTVPSGKMTYYKVRRGDTMHQIAGRYGISVQELMQINGMKQASSLRVGKSLRVYTDVVPPVAPEKSSVVAGNDKDSKKTVSHVTYYKVQKGDTLAEICARYRVNQNDLMRWNQLKSAKTLRIGQTLKVSNEIQVAQASTKAAPSADVKAAEKKAVSTASYKVQKGDTLGQIASRYNVSADDLMRWNQLKSAKALRVGQTLQVAGQSTSATVARAAPTPHAATPAVKAVETVSSVTYHKVQKGDTLGRIATRYSVSADDLMRWNGLKKATALRAGQTLRVSEATAQGAPTNTASLKKG